MDFSRTATDQLKRSLRFHENDNGTMTMEEECRRMYLVQEIGAELQRRAVAAEGQCVLSKCPTPELCNDFSACDAKELRDGLREHSRRAREG